jgi:hypothetical protein
MPNWYIIVDAKTGAWDGLYSQREKAVDAFASLTKKIPQAFWEIKEYTEKKPPFKDDFWMDVYKYGEK